MSALLYRDFVPARFTSTPSAFHTHRFFSEAQPFLDTVYIGFDSTKYLGIQFPGAWLAHMVESCVENYRQRLLNTGKLPFDIFHEVCDPIDELDLLDETSIPDDRIIKLSIGR